MITGFDHIVLVVEDVAATVDFYERTLGMEGVEHTAGKWALTFGTNKISLQPAADPPSKARDTVPGSGNFCVLTDDDIDAVAGHLSGLGVEIEDGPVEKVGATGGIMSVYFRDPDGNLVEVAQPL